jgi:hypothetical protein
MLSTDSTSAAAPIGIPQIAVRRRPGAAVRTEKSPPSTASAPVTAAAASAISHGELPRLSHCSGGVSPTSQL